MGLWPPVAEQRGSPGLPARGRAEDAPGFSPSCAVLGEAGRSRSRRRWQLEVRCPGSLPSLRPGSARGRHHGAGPAGPPGGRGRLRGFGFLSEAAAAAPLAPPEGTGPVRVHRRHWWSLRRTRVGSPAGAPPVVVIAAFLLKAYLLN